MNGDAVRARFDARTGRRRLRTRAWHRGIGTADQARGCHSDGGGRVDRGIDVRHDFGQRFFARENDLGQ
jgi:hypothetical protein